MKISDLDEVAIPTVEIKVSSLSNVHVGHCLEKSYRVSVQRSHKSFFYDCMSALGILSDIDLNSCLVLWQHEQSWYNSENKASAQ